MSKTLTPIKFESSCGKAPTNELKLASNTVRFLSEPTSGGKQPPRSLFMKIISSKFSILPMLCGIQPLNLLLANVTTETVDWPIVSGMVEVNLLLFKNNASSFISKSSGGIWPSKLLNLMSMYLTLDQDNVTFGKEPTNRLLLTSNSCISVSSEKLLGIIPQNLLEFMWNNARSVINPSSAGRYPAMSA
ncbi:hypothetical protein ERO13_A12G026901v2 [Gossypium hirsutum]|nr:hypothetical protein ERO13_A12G026901v2 [Gossypium hirsutum]